MCEGLNMYNIGLSTPCAHVTDEVFAAYRAAGITVAEISDNIDGYAHLDYANLREIAEKHGITLHSMHLPFSPFTEIDVSNPALADRTVEYYRGLMENGTGAGVRIFVLHPSGEPIREQRELRMKTAKNSLARLADIADALGAVIAVENLPRTCLGRSSAEIAELLSAHSSLRACFDTNHLLEENTFDFMRNIGGKIITTHISDYDFVNERHWLPGEGKVDWQGVIAVLSEIGYSGPWVYELGLACPKTILRDRDLAYDDFVLNASELFAGKEPTVFSRPKPNLGWWE